MVVPIIDRCNFTWVNTFNLSNPQKTHLVETHVGALLSMYDDSIYGCLFTQKTFVVCITSYTYIFTSIYDQRN